jgi:hypothetical protein
MNKIWKALVDAFRGHADPAYWEEIEEKEHPQRGGDGGVRD